MKLEIGSGKHPHQGYNTIDIEASNNPNIVGDFRTMDFKDIEEIRSQHLLEHFSREEGIKVLKLWHKWLKIGGTLIIETPDFEEICNKFKTDKYWMARHAYGSQEAEWAYHRDAWYEDKFREILPQIGFEITLIDKRTSKVIIKSPKKERHILPNILVIAVKK